MFNENEEAIIEKSKTHLEEFLKKEKRSLLTFTGDPNLMYIADSELEKFKLSPAEGILYLPLANFLDKKLDYNQIMWHIYYELSLYPDWKKNTKEYVKRSRNWQKEIDSMTIYILNKVREEGLSKDEAYKPSIISNYVKEEVLDFLHELDRFTSFLRVLQMAPIYRDKENFEKIVFYMESIGKDIDSLSHLPMHRAFVKGFLLIELYDKKPKIDRSIDNPFDNKILGVRIFEFLYRKLIENINNEKGIIERDPLIRSFIYPVFENLWKIEIDKMELEESEGIDWEEKGVSKDDSGEKIDEQMETTRDEEQEILEEMLEKEEELDLKFKNILSEKIDLNSYGITEDDQKLFYYYKNKMTKEREEMKKFWRELIGEAKKEVNVKKDKQTKGKLDIDSFIYSYPDFIEAEEKGNYKNLSIFNRYLLESSYEILPEKIEISFVIDNSGSMDESKIEAARRTLAVTLLSIEDFNRYLKNSSEKLNQEIEVLSETWFFGSDYYMVKEFDSKGIKSKDKSDVIHSIVDLNASDGATDDGSCLKEISKSISKNKEKKLKKGKEVKIIFEITDGASDFPGITKEAIDELLSKNVEVFGFQIGKNSKRNEELFNYIWKEGYKRPRGIIIGEKVEKLPKELLNLVRENMNNIFRLR